MLEARSLTVRVGTHTLLDAVSTRALAGQLTALIGPNGAGKSTLFHALAGSVVPTAGEARLFDRPITQWPLDEVARCRAVLAQHPSLAFDFRVREMVELGRIPHPRGAIADARIALEALDAVAMGTFADRHYLTLSGGEKQRVHLARALAQIWESPPQRRCLMLDEPTAHLDFAQKKIALGAARDIARAGGTVLVVLHELNLASAYADHTVLLAAGKVVAQGAPREVLTQAILQRAYGDEPEIITHPRDGRPLVI